MDEMRKKTNNKNINKDDVEDILALTPMQEGMLYQYLINENLDQYFEQITYVLRQQLNVLASMEAWNEVIKKNQVLRSIFRWEGINNPIQIILKRRPISYEIHDLTLYRENEQEIIFDDICKKDREKLMDLSEGPLFRVAIIKFSSSHYNMVISNHHIIFDGWSNGIILKDFVNEYTYIISGKKINETYKPTIKDYIKWNKRIEIKNGEGFWKEFFRNFHMQPPLVDHNYLNKNEISNSKKISGTVCNTYTLPNSLVLQIEDVMRKQSVTMGSIFLTAWGIMLQKYTEREDVAFGTTVSGRNSKFPGVENVVGMLMNTIPFRVKSLDKSSIVEILKEVHGNLICSQEYKQVSLSNIKKIISGEGEMRNIDTLIVVENYPVMFDELSKLKIGEFKCHSVTEYSVLVSINCFEKITINFIYDETKFRTSFIEVMKSTFIYILEIIAQNFLMQVRKIDFFENDERILNSVFNYEINEF